VTGHPASSTLAGCVVGVLQWAERGGCMIEDLVTSVQLAHKSIRAHLVVAWFPALFGMAMFVVFLLLAVMLILPIAPNILTHPNPAAWATAEVAAAMAPRLLLLVAVALPLLVITNAGSLYLQAQAVKGEAVDTSHFFLGVRKLSLRLIAGHAIEFALYLAILVPAIVLLMTRVMYLAETQAEIMRIPDQLAFSALMDLLPFILLSGVLFVAASVAISMWSRVLAIRDVSIGRAILDGLVFARTHFFAILIVFIGQWVLSTLLQRLLGPGELLGLVGLGMTYLLRVYVGMTMLHFYALRTGVK